MARSRNIKPGFFANEILGELPPLTRLLFIGLWTLADREGRLQDRPKKIKHELLGYDDVTSADVDEMLQQLHDNGFIIRYTVEEEKYIQVTNFLKHQNPHCREQASTIPAPGKNVTGNQVAENCREMGLGVVADHVKGRTESTSMDGESSHTDRYLQTSPADEEHSTVQAQCKHDKSIAQATLIPDSLKLIPDSFKNTSVADEPADRGREMGLGVVADHVKGRTESTSMDGESSHTDRYLQTSPVGEEQEADKGTEKKTARKAASPDWKTAKTPLEIGFCKFWDMYPGVRRRAKPACWRKWQTIKPDDEMIKQILRALKACSETWEWKKDGGQYVPAPLVWLNQGRWEDDYQEVEKHGDSQTASHTAGFRTTADY